MKIFILPNFLKEETKELLQKLLCACEKYGVVADSVDETDARHFFCADTTLSSAPTVLSDKYKDSFLDSDIMVSIGGDGTIIHSARIAAKYSKPVLGINAGKLGFLALVETDTLEESVRKLAVGHYRVEYRNAVAAKFSNGGCEDVLDFAINDIVLSRPYNCNIVHMKTCIDAKMIDSYGADGMIFSTPTGSTAYNLSAGGPILDPTINAITMVPICPHSVNIRPIVFGEDRKITVYSEDSPLMVSMDGRQKCTLLPNTNITVYTSHTKIGFVTFDQAEFFEVLTKKIKQRG